MADVGATSTSSTSTSSEDTAQFKVVVVGDGAVGKTSLCHRFTDDYFAQTYKQTVGLDWFSKQIALPGDVVVSLQIWDIGGQQIGSPMMKNYLFGAHAVIFVYDLTNYQSFQNLEDWLLLVHATGGAEPRLHLIGNKADLSHVRAVKRQRHKDWAADNDMASFFVSAKTGDNVSTTFHRIAADLAGVKLKRPDVEVTSQVLKAEIVNHPNTMPPDESGDADADEGTSKKCAIM